MISQQLVESFFVTQNQENIEPDVPGLSVIVPWLEGELGDSLKLNRNWSCDSLLILPDQCEAFLGLLEHWKGQTTFACAGARISSGKPLEGRENWQKCQLSDMALYFKYPTNSCWMCLRFHRIVAKVFGSVDHFCEQPFTIRLRDKEHGDGQHRGWVVIVPIIKEIAMRGVSDDLKERLVHIREALKAL